MNWAQSPTIIKFSLASPLNMYVQLYIYIYTWSFGGFWMSLLLELRTGRWWKILVSQLWKLVNAEGILLFQLSLDWLKWGLAWQYHRSKIEMTPRFLFHFVEAVTFLIQPGAFGLMGLDPFTNQHKFNTTEKNKNPEKEKSTEIEPSFLMSDLL